MPSQSREPHPRSTFISLSRLSPYDGLPSIALATLGLMLVSMICFAHLLFPSLGIIGTCIAILGMSLVTERVSRPFVLWLLGRQVYLSLTELVGKEIADEVSRIYYSGRTITDAQFEAFIEQGGFNRTSKTEQASQ